MRGDREVVYVERPGGGGVKWLVLGAVLGAGVALLFAPRSGKELRREIGKGAKRLKALADDTFDELREEFETEAHPRRSASDAETWADEEDAEREEPVARRPAGLSAREELERRLAAARARRRTAKPGAPDEEEPVA